MLRDMLRHTSIRSTEWYMRLSPERKREYLEQLDEMSAIQESE